jgi:hypothetical protein
LSLHGIGLIDYPDMQSLGSDGGWRNEGCDIELRPRAKILLRRGKRLFRRDVSCKRKQRLIRSVVLSMEFRDDVAREFLYRLRSALTRQPVRRIPVKSPVEYGCR